MNRNLQILKKTVLTLAILLMTTASAWALEITFTQNNQNINTNYTVSNFLPENVTINVPSGWTCTYSGVISGGINNYTPIHKTGAGKVIITNANTVKGVGIAIEAGTFQLGNGTSNGSFDNMSTVVISSGATLRFEPKDGDLTFAKVIQGAGKVEYKGLSGHFLNLTAANTYTGGTTVEGGYLCIGNFTTTGSIQGNVVVKSGAYLTFSRSNEYIFEGIISGAGSVGKAAAGKTILTGANTYTGKTYIKDGTLQVGNGTSATATIGTTSNVEIQTANGVLRFEPGAAMIFSKVISGEGGTVEYYGASNKKLYFTATNTYTGDTYISGGGHLHIGNNGTSGSIAGNIHVVNGYLTFYRTNTYTYSGKISGLGNVCNFGSGKTILTGVNAYSGGTLINGGTLQVGNGTSGSISSTSGVEIYSGKTLRFEPGSNMTFYRVISGGGNVEYKGSFPDKRLCLTANNTYEGTTTIEAGDLHIGTLDGTGNTAAAAIKGNIINKGNALVFAKGTNAYTYSGVISGTGMVYKGYGTGKVTLTGANTYTGQTFINEGTLQIGNGTSMAATIGSTSQVQNYGTLRFELANNMIFSKVISGTGKVEYKGLGICLYLTGNNTYTGTTTNEAGGYLSIGNNTTTGAIAGNIVNNSHLIFARSNSYTYSGAISGTGAVLHAGTSTLTFTGTNTYEGGTTIASGCALRIGDNGTTGSIKGNVTDNGTLRFNRGNSYTYEGVISGTGNVSIDGSSSSLGILTLSGVNTYTGVTHISSKLALTGSIEKSSEVKFMSNNGKLDISAGNKKIQSLASGSVTTPIPFNFTGEVVLGERTLTIGTAGQDNGGGSFRGTFSGNGSVTKTGTATFTMSGASTAIGTFTHSQGRVKLNGSTWAGKYNKAAGVPLTVTGNVNIGGTLTLAGGEISMDLTTTTPSKITVDGIVAASETNTLKITTNVISNQVLIQATGGIPDTWPYKVYPLAGLDAELTANNTQLLLSTKVGIEEVVGEVTGFRVYPNPTTGELRIDMSDEMSDMRCEIYDIYGRKMSQISNLKSQISNQINISHLPSGVYFVRIQTENKMITQKIIKQ